MQKFKSKVSLTSRKAQSTYQHSRRATFLDYSFYKNSININTLFPSPFCKVDQSQAVNVMLMYNGWNMVKTSFGACLPVLSHFIVQEGNFPLLWDTNKWCLTSHISFVWFWDSMLPWLPTRHLKAFCHFLSTDCSDLEAHPKQNHTEIPA